MNELSFTTRRDTLDHLHLHMQPIASGFIHYSAHIHTIPIGKFQANLFPPYPLTHPSFYPFLHVRAERKRGGIRQRCILPELPVLFWVLGFPTNRNTWPLTHVNRSPIKAVANAQRAYRAFAFESPPVVVGNLRFITITITIVDERAALHPRML